MATQPLESQSTLAVQYMAYIVVPLFIITFPTLQILGKTTKSFRIEGWLAVAISAILIAADLAFNAGAAIAIGHVKVEFHLSPRHHLWCQRNASTTRTKNQPP